MKTLIFVRTLAPYAIPRFRALTELGKLDFEVLALGSSERTREWVVPTSRLGFPFTELMPGRCVDSTDTKALECAVTKALDLRNPDVICTAGYGEAAMRRALIWAIHRNRVAIMISDSTYIDHRRFFPVEILKSWLVRRCNGAFVSGERAANYLERLGLPAQRIWRRSSVVENKWFSNRAAMIRKGGAEIKAVQRLPQHYFLYVGRLAPEKNLARLLEAFLYYQRSSKSNKWALVIVGAGPQEAEVRRLIERNGIQEVYMVGFQQMDELVTFYAFASCLILPSRSETWGLVVNEAMAAGLPVLVSVRCGCVPELVHQGINGFIFDPMDTEGLARLMVLMSSGDVNLETMKSESQQIISNYTPGAWAQSLYSCVASCLNEKSPS